MAVEIRLPELGENVKGGDVVSVKVKSGDTVREDQPLLELETDKATVEVPAEQAGTVTEVRVKEGDHVEVGQVILFIEAAGEESKAATPDASSKSDSESAPGESPAAEDPAAQAPEQTAKPESPDRPKASVVEFRERPRAEEAASRKLVPASPAVRRFAREIGIDVNSVPGSGPRGRVSVDDVKAYSRKLQSASGSAAAPAGIAAAPPLPDFSRFGQVEREKFSNIRKATARNLSLAWQQVVHVTNHDKADVTRLEELRGNYSPQVEQAGAKLTVTAILLKLCAVALRQFPKFNASLDMAAEQVIFKRYVHIGVAVDTPKGLLVPVIRNVDQKSLTQLAVELKEQAEKARSGKIQLDDLQGGCFTITNLGGIGGNSFTPIVNYPEVAILGVSRTAVEPVWINDRFEPRKLLPLSLSYDHRLVDGADAARFLRRLVELLEEPFTSLL